MYPSFPQGPYNLYSYFISPNPITSFNPVANFPRIHPSAFIGPFVSVIGDVVISFNVFVGPGASLRADEGTPFFIGPNTNIQDGVVFHGIMDQGFYVGPQRYSIYVGSNVTCAHGCIIHGPCIIGNHCFVGFQSTIFNSILEEGVYVSSNVVVTNRVRVAAHRFIPPGATIDTQAKADSLGFIPTDREAFAQQVQRVNHEFPPTYSLYFGSTRCSCGLCCDV